MRTVADFTVTANQRFPFTLVWYPSNEEPPPPLDSYYAVHLTEAYWTEWAAQCNYEGPYRDAVVRSLITLKALTYNPTGGIVAAATTSLPEALGGNRNWDYRFCWLRDATLTLESLMRGGYHTEALAWRDWLLRAVAGDVSKLQIMYGPGGERRLDEWEADWLPGYEDSVPVRIGNAASDQYQLDVYGEVMSALYSSALAEGSQSRASWGLQRQLVEFLEKGWTGARRRHLGGAGAAAALHPFQGDGLGGRRPGRAHVGGVARPRRADRDVAQAAGRHLQRGLRQGLQQGRRRLHPVLRVGHARCQRAHDPVGRLPPARATPGW